MSYIDLRIIDNPGLILLCSLLYYVTQIYYANQRFSLNNFPSLFFNSTDMILETVDYTKRWELDQFSRSNILNVN